MDTHRIRNLIPMVYAILVVGAFFISTTVVVIVAVVGGMVSGLLWATLSGSVASTGPRGTRRTARATRRAGR